MITLVSTCAAACDDRFHKFRELKNPVIVIRSCVSLVSVFQVDTGSTPFRLSQRQQSADDIIFNNLFS